MWRVLDPILIKIARRMEHLASHHPSDYRQRITRGMGTFSSTARVTSRTRVESLAPADHLEVGDYSLIEGEIFLLAAESRCRIGHHAFLAADSRLWVLGTMTIGNYVLIAPGVDVFDNDSHPLDANRRREDAIDQFERGGVTIYRDVTADDVVIEDDVWIGTKSTIMKGVRLGQGAVIAAGSVVTRDVERFTLVAGNPAREVRKLL